LAHWGSIPFQQCIEYLREISQILNLSILGVKQLSRMFPLAKALHELEIAFGESEEGGEAYLNKWRKLADISTREIKYDFPMLHAHALVGIWSALDSLVEDILVAFLLHDPSIRRKEDVLKIKVTLLDYYSLDEESKFRYIAKQIRSNLKYDLKRGITRVDAIFKYLGINVDIDQETRRCFFEMNCLRNAIVHQAGRVDDKLSKDCPWLGLVPGERINISHEQIERYQISCAEYLTNILHELAKMAPQMKKRGITFDE
jgi:hypothetical protein